MDQRVRAQKLKDKRKAALDARLAKVRERKFKKLKASGELSEETFETEDSEQSEKKEENLSDGAGETTVGKTERRENNVSKFDTSKTTIGTAVEERLLDAREQTSSSQRPVGRKADLPEWAQQKISK